MLDSEIKAAIYGFGKSERDWQVGLEASCQFDVEQLRNMTTGRRLVDSVGRPRATG